jgi:serine protease Do
VTRGRIGVRLQEVTTELARAFQLPRTAGALVLEVFKGSGAARAAILPGDVIVRFGGQPIETDGDLVRFTAAAKPGTYVDLDLVRFGAPLTARVRIDEARAPAMPPAPPPLSERDLAGLKVAPLTAQQRQRLRVDAGLLVETPGALGRQAGLQRGDIVLSVNGRTVSNADAFRSTLSAAGKGATVALLVQRDGARQFLPLRLPR